MLMQETPSLAMGIFALVQAIILLAMTPLMTGISRQIRARMQSRRGPGIWQDYRDLSKLFKRQEVGPAQSGIIFRLMPYVCSAACCWWRCLFPSSHRLRPSAARVT